MKQGTPTKKRALIYKTKEGIFFLLLFFMASCSKSCYWKYQEIETQCPLYRTASLFHQSDNQFSGLKLEFLKGSYGTKGFISVFASEIPPALEDPKMSRVIIAIDETVESFLAVRMEGGQKVLLPENATFLLIDALQAQRKVVVALDGYYSEIPACDFPKFYKSFDSLI